MRTYSLEKKGEEYLGQKDVFASFSNLVCIIVEAGVSFLYISFEFLKF